MKRIGNLYDTICSTENLYAAYLKAKQGKAKSYGVVLFDKNFESNMEAIQAELISGCYRTSEYSVFKIYDPKERDVYRLPFRDRVAHHSIMNVVGKIWVSTFISHTYACIKGRGINGVLVHLKRDLKDVENTRYCLKMDVKKFYPSVDHEILKAIVRKKIKDVRLLKLLDEIIDSAPGVPIGNYLSQFLANLYLTYFDHWMKEYKRVKYYYRYADDIVILAPDKPYLQALLVDISDYLKDRLNLQLKGNYQVFPVAARGIDFVGYKFYHTHTLMRKTIKVRFCRKVAKLNKKDIDEKAYKMQISPHLGWAKHCNSKHLIKKIIKHEEIL
jgi:retron-type reverse transcriptase